MAALLTTYLQDHHAGASGGTDAFERVAEGHSDPVVREAVTRLAAEVAQDEVSLEEVMALAGAESSTVKDAAAALGEKVARLKPNQRLAERSPLSDVLELEALVDAVHAKGLMWTALVALGDERLAEVPLQQLADRAERQRRELDELRLSQVHKLAQH